MNAMYFLSLLPRYPHELSPFKIVTRCKLGINMNTVLTAQFLLLCCRVLPLAILTKLHFANLQERRK